MCTNARTLPFPPCTGTNLTPAYLTHAAHPLSAWHHALAPAAPEGWNNDPNGVTFDPHTGIYHRFYQYDPTYSETKHSGNVPRTWGQTVSKDLVYWEDWPGIYADTPWDEHGVFSGNCAFNGSDPNPICIYSNNPCNIGVCATSKDGWVTWEKRACMTHAPSPQSQVGDIKCALLSLALK